MSHQVSLVVNGVRTAVCTGIAVLLIFASAATADEKEAVLKFTAVDLTSKFMSVKEDLWRRGSNAAGPAVRRGPRGIGYIVRPPSTMRTWPVTRDASRARNATTSATCSGVAAWRIGVC
jgi:hypothetical protein